MAYSFESNLHTAARLYYDQLSPEVQQYLTESFRFMDADGNGVISQAELVRSCKQSGGPLSAMVPKLPKLFSVLDKDGNRSLDFNECKSLFYLLSSSPTCDHCGDFTLDFAYSCQDCWALHEASFDLCLNCYPAMVRTHHHRNFTPRTLIINQTLVDHLKKVQCVVCGDFHSKDVSGILLGTHMVMDTVSGNHVCEWCITWSCSGCGKYFQGPRSCASPGRWLLTSYYCTQCGATGNRTSRASTIKKIKESNVVRSCSTCRIKANNSTLWAGCNPTDPSPETSRTVQISECHSSSNESSAFVNYIDAANQTVELASNIADAITTCSIL